MNKTVGDLVAEIAKRVQSTNIQIVNRENHLKFRVEVTLKDGVTTAQEHFILNSALKFILMTIILQSVGAERTDAQKVYDQALFDYCIITRENEQQIFACDIAEHNSRTE